MITGALVLVLVVGREVARAANPNGAAADVLGRLLVPAALGLVALLALRLLDVVVGGA